MSRYSGWKLGTVVGCATFLAATAAPASYAADRAEVRASAALPASIESLRLAAPIVRENVTLASIDPALTMAKGRQEVLVRLRSPAAALSVATGPADQVMRKEQLKIQQDAFLQRASRKAPSMRAKQRMQVLLNAVVMDIDAQQIKALATDPDVVRISRVINYSMDLSDTVPYITATAMQNIGFDGSGVKVAVLDSGIDYTHAAFGGGGTLADYEAAYGTSPGDSRNTSRDGLFPTAKVVEGYDFVGESWPNTDLAPDDDPIDYEGHGSHVADIIGGAGGVAPGVDLYAVKVCSAVSTSCSGVALIQGMEYAADPNGDGDTSDRVDVINMSLGSTYGQAFDDDLALAVNNASAIGILTVASAGNSSDKPYVTGTPAAAITALSVAQTEVPSAFLPQYDVVAPAGIAGTYDAIFQPWSAPLTSIIEAPMQYADGAGGNLNGCAAFAPGSLAGKIVLVDRGACNFTLKIKNIGDAGGLIGIIGLIAPGEPFSGGDGGDRPIDIPGYMISQADSNTLKSGLPATVLRFDPNIGIPLVGNMVGSSSRGPRNPDNLLKPEIGAPGASVSAIAGSGTGTGPFGGTSGAAPMVTGSAALILDAYPGLTPVEVKARLVNNGELNISTDPFSGPAPVSRIGGGEVRVLDAYQEPIAAWAEDQYTGDYVGSLSFGQVDVAKDVVRLKKKVRVRNYTDKAVQYNIRPTFRFADDEASGAISFKVKSSVRVGPHRDATFPVTIEITGANLAGNAMNSGSEGANPAALTFNEFDGYLMLEDGSGSSVHVPWHVLPRKAADLRGRNILKFRNGFTDAINLKNRGVGTAQIDAYSLLATSPNIPQGPEGGQAPTPDIRAVGITTIPVPAGFCSDNESFLWVFAINTWERQSHLVPVSHQVSLDTNQDGSVDYVVLNRDLSGPSTITDGRQVAWVLDVATGSLSAFFFAEHATNTGNTALTICGEQIGMNAADMLTTRVNMDVYTQDFYFGGPGDEVNGLTVTPLGERYFGVPEDIAGKSSGTVQAYDFGTLPGNTDELGLLLFTNGDRGAGNRGGAVQEGEALLLTNP
jgi:subtilisin family serine protease